MSKEFNVMIAGHRWNAKMQKRSGIGWFPIRINSRPHRSDPRACPRAGPAGFDSPISNANVQNGTKKCKKIQIHFLYIDIPIV